MDPLQKEIEVIEKELLEIMIKQLKAEKMSPEEAQQMAKDFLALLPIHDKKELLQKLKQLSDLHADAKEVYIDELGKQEEDQRDIVLNHMRDAIAQGDITKALQTAKDYKGTAALRKEGV